MKTKTFARKLVLNKKTIADISGESMKKVQAGHDSSPTCPILYTCHLVIYIQTRPYYLCKA